MSEEETNELIEAMKEATKQITSSRESAVKFLQKVGILDENEEFTEIYAELGKACTPVTQD